MVPKMVDLLRAANARVSAGTMTKGQFTDLEMAVGLNYNPLGLLAECQHLRNGRCTTYYLYIYVCIYICIDICMYVYM
jgi:hypothetical protein